MAPSQVVIRQSDSELTGTKNCNLRLLLEIGIRLSNTSGYLGELVSGVGDKNQDVPRLDYFIALAKGPFIV